MKKTLILTSLLAIVATTGAANATIEGTESAQIKANLETDFKIAPNESDYTLTAPDGTDSTLADVEASAYTNYSATTVADGTNVALNDGVILNIAQGAVDATNYKYSSKNADGVASMVAGDTAVSDLSKDYTSTYITSPITVSTADSGAPAIELGTNSGDAIYHTDDGSFYLLKVGDDILLNGSQTITEDNTATYQELLAAYNEDVNALEALYSTLVGYKGENATNAAAVTTAVSADNEAISAIVANQATFTDANTQYTSDAAENTAYVGSLAEAIDTSIATGANDAIDASVAGGTIKTALDTKANSSDVDAIANDLATNYSTTAQIEAGITDLIATKEANISEQLGYDVSKNPANAEEPDSLTSKLKSHDTSIVAAINTNYDAISDEKARATAAELQIRDDFAAADAETLASAKAYSDAGDALTLESAKSYADAGNTVALNQAKAYTDERVEKLDKDLSAGVASAIALSSVSVSGVKRGEVSVGGGYGYFNGQSAAAFGAAMGLSDRWSINAGAGVSNADIALRAGTNYKFKLF